MTPKTPIKSLKSVQIKTGGMKNPLGKNYFWMIAVVFFLIVIVALGATNGKLTDKLKGKGSKNISAEDAGNKLKGFVDKVYSRNVKGFEIQEIKDESGLYAITALVTDINDNTSTSTLHVSKDGRFFLANAMDMDDVLKQISAQDSGGAAVAPANIPKSDNPKVELFTMSYCPFGNQAEQGISPVARLLKEKVDIEPHYVIYADYRGGGEQYCLDSENKYCSMHGVEELKQDVRELCIYKYNKSKYWDYIDAVNAGCDLNNIESCWSKPAEDLGIDTGKIESCFNDEAMDILAQEVALGQKYGITGSPALVINGARYEGGRAPENYKIGICGAFNSQPEVCNTQLGQAEAASAGGCE